MTSEAHIPKTELEREFLTALEAQQQIIHKICRMYRDRAQDREDLFQEIVYQLWRSYPSFQGQSKFSSWLYRIALNTAMATYRKKALQLELHDHFPESLHPASAEGSDQEKQLFKALR